MPLAIDGGTPVRTRPLPPWPHFDDEMVAAAAATLRSGRVNQWTGQQVRAFEAELAQRFGRRHAVALANGTLALELGLLAAGVGPGDEVVVTPRSFFASASAVVRVGARPVFADVDERTQALCAASIEAVRTERTRAVLLVHLGGWPAEVEPIAALCERHGWLLLEDCAQAHGAEVAGRPVGTWGQMAAFSFCQDKILTTAGEGGALLCDEDALYERAWSLKDHGKSLAKVREGARPGTGFRWLHDAFGTNWRLSEVQAAVGRVQLRRLDDWLARRRLLGEMLTERLAEQPALRVPRPAARERPAYYRFYAFVRPERLRPGWDRDRLLRAIAAEGIPCGVGSCPEIYREEAFEARGWQPEHPLPVARRLGETSMAFHVHPTMTMQDAEQTAEAIEKVLAEATNRRTEPGR